jgi:hypothetical protein
VVERERERERERDLKCYYAIRLHNIQYTHREHGKIESHQRLVPGFVVERIFGVAADDLRLLAH